MADELVHQSQVTTLGIRKHHHILEETSSSSLR
jgi:hypothetical protein